MSKMKLLVIDDERAVREAVTDIMELVNVDVLAAENGRLGLELFARNREEIGLILLDLTMPGLSGEETLHQIRLQDGTIPVVVSSGYNQSAIAGRLNMEAATDFLQKPYLPDQLLGKIKRFLG